MKIIASIFNYFDEWRGKNDFVAMDAGKLPPQGELAITVYDLERNMFKNRMKCVERDGAGECVRWSGIHEIIKEVNERLTKDAK